MRGLGGIALAWLAAALAGCATVRSDLAAPAYRRAFDGPPVAVAAAGRVLPVVTDETPVNRAAAQYLATMIEATCGRRPPIVQVLPGQACAVTNGLFVGDAVANEPAASPLPEEGFRVVAREGSVRFLGRTDFAAYDWCERALGVRCYFDGGTCVESRDEIVVPAGEYADHPVFARRILWSGNSAWAQKSKGGNAHRGGVNVHAPHGWYTNAAIRAEHPGIFETGRTPMLCYGKPETLAYYRRRIARHLAGVEDSGGIVDVGRRVITVSPWDAPVRCTCPDCARLRDPSLGRGGDASPIVWGWFLKELSAWVRRTYPDYLVSFLPYLNTCAVPPGLRVEGCEAEVCTMPGLALLKDDGCRRKEEGLLRAWQAATGRKVINWHYGCWPQDWTSAPYVFGRTIARHYRDLREVTDGTFVCGGATDARLALSMYVWMRCLWNPDVDVEAIYDEFARRMFGSAAGPMRELIGLQESCWERPWDGTQCTYRNVFEVSYPPADERRLRELLDEAYRTACAAGDGTGAANVRWYASGFRRFFEDAAAARAWTPWRVRLGTTNEMVVARSVRAPTPWARTRVTTAADAVGGALCVTVRCDEPAAAKLDFSRRDFDFARGDDCVKFVVEDGGAVRVFRVFADGSVESDPSVGSGAASAPTFGVAHDAAGWTVRARVPVSAEARARGFVRGNVCRWRVGDRRRDEATRVPGSRYEASRLSTRQTQPDDDSAAFVEFEIGGTCG